MNMVSRITGLLDIQSKLGKLQSAIVKYRKSKEEGKEMNSLSIFQLLKSKTFWTGVAGAAFNMWNNAHGSVLGIPISETVAGVINGAIALGVAVFRMFPQQQGTDK